MIRGSGYSHGEDVGHKQLQAQGGSPTAKDFCGDKLGEGPCSCTDSDMHKSCKRPTEWKRLANSVKCY